MTKMMMMLYCNAMSRTGLQLSVMIEEENRVEKHFHNNLKHTTIHHIPLVVNE